MYTVKTSFLNLQTTVDTVLASIQSLLDMGIFVYETGSTYASDILNIALKSIYFLGLKL